VADVDGTINSVFNDTLSQLFGPFGIVGRTITLQQYVDDLGSLNDTESLTSGNSGDPIACGLIGIVQG
jgi:Cu-Zn family superoxide dismutase